MENLIRRRNLPNVYIGDTAFSVAGTRSSMENGNACPGSVQRTTSIKSSASSIGDVSKRVTFNVGGTCFQTTEKSFNKIKAKHFKKQENLDSLAEHYDSTRDEYFYDRDPEVFRSVLNYWRTDHLHIPTTMCGPQIIDEMKFWELSPMAIEACCFNTYSSWIKSMHALQKLEKDRQLSYLRPNLIKPDPNASRYKRATLATWYMLTDPSYSTCAKIYAYFSLCFVILAIFSFCASTHHDFTVSRKIYRNVSDTININNNNNNNSINNIIDNNIINNIINTTTTAQNTSSTPPTAVPSITPTIINSNNDKNSVVNPKTTATTTSDSCKNKTGTGTTVTVIEVHKEERDVHPALSIIDWICLSLFTLEYLVRLFCAPNRRAFIISFTAIIDFLAILPDYIEFIVFAFYPENSESSLVQFMPFLRLMRVFRIFRLVQRVPGLWIMIYTLRASFKELSLMLMFLLVGTLFFSSVIFFVDDQAVFKSIPHSFWWAIVTMTTVGYGDMTPKTAWGQLMGSVTAVCGVLLVGFTIPALVNNFITYCQFIEFAMRNPDTIEQDVRRVTMKEKRGIEDEEGGEVEQEDSIDLEELNELSSVTDIPPDSPLNESNTPLTMNNINISTNF